MTNFTYTTTISNGVSSGNFTVTPEIISEFLEKELGCSVCQAEEDAIECYTDELFAAMSAENVVFDAENKTTIVYWGDGGKTSVTCRGEDKYSEEMGFIMCFFKRFSPDWSKYNEILENAKHIKRKK